MDLENFDTADGVDTRLSTSTASLLSAEEAVDVLDERWYTKVNRRARWMDLLGDYAGSECFVIDGDSLLQIVLDDHLLALGRPDEPSFQLLHACQSLERLLDDFIRRQAVFEIVFFKENRHLTISTGCSPLVTASRSLARTLLCKHLHKLSIPVHTFCNLSDCDWLQYRNTTKPMFVMANDGGLLETHDSLAAARILCQRIYLFDLLADGIAVSLLRGAEFRDSKILAFVNEQRFDVDARDMLPSALRDAVSVSRATLDDVDARATLSHRLTPLSDDFDDISDDSTVVSLVHISQAYFSTTSPNSPHLELTYIFIVHCLMLENVSVEERAQRLEPLHLDLLKLLSGSFLPVVLRAVDVFILSTGASVDIDGHLFISLIRYIIENSSVLLSAVIGTVVHQRADVVWSKLGFPAIDLVSFAARFPNPPMLHPTRIPDKEPFRLLPFNNEVFNDELASIHVEVDENSETPSPHHAHMEFGRGTLFADTQHWHNPGKAILPKHLGGEGEKPKNEWQRRRALKKDQRFMVTLRRQAETMKGALGATLKQIVIPPVGSTQAPRSSKVHPVERVKQPLPHGKKAKSKPLSSKEMLLKKIAEDKLSTQEKSSTTWWQGEVEKMKTMDRQKAISTLNDLMRNKRSQEPAIGTDMRLYRLNLELLRWTEDSNPKSSEVRDRYTVSVMRMIKDIIDLKNVTPTTARVLSSVLNVLGFTDYASAILTSSGNTDSDRPSAFSFIKLIKSKTKLIYPFMRITEHPIIWQLRLFGEFMDRSMDSKEDIRVAFKPDAWQRQVLDVIDKDGSLLVVAPTSAGKTFISFYAMERLLRNSDDGILVYVAPTKALVTQIAAEVSARFSKELNGRSCWAIHTRDYRIHDPQNCQILVTVPEMLAIMLLSPPLARTWTPRVKRIILDEIHSIGQQEGGAIWEQIILLAPCPIIGLSATIGAPEVFNNWLQSVQEGHGYKHTFISHPHRYSHLRKFTYALQAKGTWTFGGLDSHQSTQRLRFLHPVSILSFGVRLLPSDLSMEAADTLSLFQALVASKDTDRVALEHLEPSVFFDDSPILRQRDIVRYEVALKDVLSTLIASHDPRDQSSTLRAVVTQLQDPILRDIPIPQLSAVPSRPQFRENLILLLSDLHVSGNLPAILFNFDRTECEIMAKDVLDVLQRTEQSWRARSDEWKTKMQRWEAWKAQKKQREKQAEKAKKIKMDSDAPPPSDDQQSWESHFYPEDPSPQFSFANLQTSYSRGDLDDDISNLRRTSTPKWAIDALFRGIAVHHAGMSKPYRSLVESLFRLGFIRVMIATGTLALGINAPAKTSVFCGDSPFLTALMYRQCAGRAGRRGFDLLGNVVFYGLAMNRVQRLVLSKLPSLGGNFPLTSTLCLRLLNLLEGSNDAPVAVHAIRSILKLPQISFGSDTGRDQLLHHLRFSVEYLRQSGLLDPYGRSMNLFSIAAHLYYTEPSNFALVALLRNGILHRISAQPSLFGAKRDFITLMSHLFGRRYLPKTYTTRSHLLTITRKSPSVVVLPPLPEDAKEILIGHDKEILRVFIGYAMTFTSQYGDQLGRDFCLPLSGNTYGGNSVGHDSLFRQHLNGTRLSFIVRSPFVANSGHRDDFASVEDLVRTARKGLNLNEHAIPSMAKITSEDDSSFSLNAYILDFYTHGQVAPLASANGIRRGDVWYLLQDFMLSMMTIRGGLQQLLLKASQESDIEGQDERSSAELDDNDEHVIEGDFKRPTGVSDSDWRVYEIVDAATKEFDEKFKKMWA